MQANTTTQSEKLFQRSQQFIPGGVNSPVRAFRQVGGTPRFISHAEGAYLFDEDGNKYIDFINSWGPMILGHAHPKVVEAVHQQLKKSLSYGAPTKLEMMMAELIVSMVPNIDMVRMVSSGTEACMSAIRLARGVTGKSKFIKFEGHYHGHADQFLKKAGSGMATFNIKVEAGITKGTSDDTLVANYNDIESVQKLIDEFPNDIAAIILEPVAGNMGCVIPVPGFLAVLRTLCDKNNILLIFDEVMTGFRLAKGGAQELLNVKADIVTFGKVIGGGMPVGAFAASKEIMQHISPLGNVYQAGTLSGNPLAMTAGYTSLRELNEHPEIYTSLGNKTTQLEQGISQALNKNRISHTINRIGSMISVHFSSTKVTDFANASSCNNEHFKKFFHHMLDQGVYLPPSPFESWFVSNSIGNDELNKTINAVEKFSLNE
ncbi:MAG: glutamate-1-semialdehyde 2,1-aminomutase [Bacteroidia bacterium]